MMERVPINHKEAQVIQYLHEHLEQYLSSTLIGEQLEMSDRTARKYIHQSNELVERYGANIEIKKGHGYRLVIQEVAKFNILLDRLRKDESNLSDVYAITQTEDRERYLLSKVFLENKCLTVTEYAKELLVSRSTIMHLIQSIREQLSKYELTLSNNTNEGIQVHGAEIEKRRFILKYFFGSDTMNHFMKLNRIDEKEEGFTVETLSIIVLEECRNGSIQLSDYVMQNLVIHLALAIIRIKAGNVLETSPVSGGVDLRKEMVIAKKMIQRIEASVDITFPEDESMYIGLHLKSRSNQLSTFDEPWDDSTNDLQLQVMETLLEIEQSSDLRFKLDAKLLMGLNAHFDPLMTRLKMGIPLKNPLLKEVKVNYPEVFQITKEYFKKMPLLEEYQVDDHEWAYITLHLLAAVERSYQSQQLKVIVICATGLGSAQMLRNRLENEFGKSIQIMDVISYYQLTDQVLEEVDLIISTLEISNTFFNIPVINVSVFLTEDNIADITHHIKEDTKRLGRTKKTQESTTKLEGIFNQYFDPSRFILFEETSNRVDVLRDMIQRLSDSQGEGFVDDFMQHIELREYYGTLAFSETVAFPHPSTPLGVNSEVVVGLIPDGIEWDLEHPDVKFIILMSPSKLTNKNLNLVTDYFVEFVQKTDIQAQLLEQPTFEHFKETFLKNKN
ncbi:BglG family transcription antiterminator [Fundicoccus sp. Sow4_D5]|uniref:BglG family transcription antiterminator n=1 Tax=Fundicoccus sp. Sow4_D5 TaxID=3438782 RepID=UPI003F90B649